MAAPRPRHLDLARRFLGTLKGPAKASMASHIGYGDLVRPIKTPAGSLTFVRWATAQKANVLDLEAGDWKKQIFLSFLAKVNPVRWKPVK